ncbi:unnamed protein product [Wickerhamomyces anomalus]
MSDETISWEQLSSTLEKDLFLSSYQNRIAALENLISYLTKSEKVDNTSITEIQSVLLKHYSNFLDLKSIKLSTEILSLTFHTNKESLVKFVQAFNKFSTKHKSLAFNDLTVLSTWTDSIVSNFAKDEIYSKLIQDIIQSQIFIFDSIYTQKTDDDSKHKIRIRNSIEKSTRGALTHLSNDQITQYFKILTSDTESSIDAIITLIGLISFNSSSITEEERTLVIEYYKKVVLVSKLPLSNAPALSLSKHLFKALPSTFDLPKYFVESKLMSQIISSYKSSKENVRDLALENFGIAVSYESTEKTLTTVVDELLKALKSLSATDQKALVAKSLTLIPSNYEAVSNKIVSSLLNYVAKDQNEVSLNELLSAYFKHFLSSFQNDWATSNDAKSAALKGFKDPKLQLRKLWFTTLGSTLQSFELSDQLTHFLSENFAAFVSSSEEVFNNPTNNFKGITIPYVVSFIAGLIKGAEGRDDFFAKALADGNKPSVLTNPRVYSKFTTT